jgi:hypothetical protein
MCQSTLQPSDACLSKNTNLASSSSCDTVCVQHQTIEVSTTQLEPACTWPGQLGMLVLPCSRAWGCHAILPAPSAPRLQPQGGSCWFLVPALCILLHPACACVWFLPVSPPCLACSLPTPPCSPAFATALRPLSGFLYPLLRSLPPCSPAFATALRPLSGVCTNFSDQLMSQHLYHLQSLHHHHLHPPQPAARDFSSTTTTSSPHQLAPLPCYLTMAGPVQPTQHYHHSTSSLPPPHYLLPPLATCAQSMRHHQHHTSGGVLASATTETSPAGRLRTLLTDPASSAGFLPAFSRLTHSLTHSSPTAFAACCLVCTSNQQRSSACQCSCLCPLYVVQDVQQKRRSRFGLQAPAALRWLGHHQLGVHLFCLAPFASITHDPAVA